MSDYIASDDQISIVSSLSTTRTDPNTLTELRHGSDYGQGVSVDVPQQIWGATYADINWGRLAGYIQPGQKMEKRGWFWDHGYDIQKGTDTKARCWLCRACHTTSQWSHWIGLDWIWGLDPIQLGNSNWSSWSSRAIQLPKIDI